MPVDIAPASRTPHPSRTAREARSRPLLVRAGARFACFGDGLCCTDIHALGPVSRREKRHLGLLVPGALVRSEDLLAPVFRTQQHGACVLRSTRGCELHAVHGAAAKPSGCTRFPFNLVATPEGGRVTTEHRCPCRTLGARPLLTPEMAEPSLGNAAGRLQGNGKVGTRVALERGKRVAFSRFCAEESEVIAGLLALRDPLATLATKPFGKLYQARWGDVAEQALAESDGTAYGVAMAWFGRAIRVCSGTERRLDTTERPWSAAYDRAECRGAPQPAEVVLADFLADLVWSLDWTFSMGTFAAGKREIATLYAIALQITDALVGDRVREDRAAAEAITIVELARQSQAWDTVQKAL